MSAIERIIHIVASSEAFGTLLKKSGDAQTVLLSRLAGSAFAVVAAAYAAKRGGVHIIVMQDRDSAAYLCNDLYALMGEGEAMFFPSSYKKSIVYGTEDTSSVVQRTAVLDMLGKAERRNAVICTYPEAVAETVAGRSELQSRTLTLSVGMRVSMEIVEQELTELGFERVDFVYQPGQYSVRGGIMDIFSYSENRPVRLDFFGEEIDSVRTFEISSQLSVEKRQSCTVVPKLTAGRSEMVSFAAFVGNAATYWVDDYDHTLSTIDALRRKLIPELENPSDVDSRLSSSKRFEQDTASVRMLLRTNTAKRPAEMTVLFDTAPQPKFNKQFDLLARNMEQSAENGYRTYILSENKAQIERLRNILYSQNPQVSFEPLGITLHEGFSDNQTRVNIYTDHQIFDRYHRYKLRGEINRDQSMTVAELNELKVGDFVVHIDHGIGRFGGMVKTMDNGKEADAVKLVYRDNDVLLVNVHNIHRISRYKSADSEPPRINKLGSASWQRMKTATKNAVKDIARELIALYAKRKAGGGFAFSPDGYLQNELEASFAYEDTPDQQKANELVKRDMESPEPMDRLVCGDVGFGKTEVAVRAAFKAACDSKQVAVLVPTTILSLQHYRTFSERLKGFPVRVEYLNRSKSASETKQILADVKAGSIDILIGTHKILGKNVEFKDLGLLIIDEEQKFGVSDKEKLRQMSVHVDTLTLTATPIPRTLQFSLMGSRDLSIISTPPPNRMPIVTESHTFGEEIIKDAIDYELSRGGQVYFVHNRVEDIKRVEGMINRLCPDAKTVVGHGQMKADQLEKTIMDFIFGEYDVLIATTIVENGIDIPNANTIIIDGAQNFGLSELHQLRGRVGRSNRKAFCYLLSPPDEQLSSDSRRRLRAIEEFSDLGSGFNIAMQDLDIRGAGNLFGAEQSGFIADIGFETYRKILDEAIEELRADGVAGVERLVTGDSDGRIRYVSDCYIETDVEAGFPDDYISQSAEKLKLYRELDSITDEGRLDEFVAELQDRFGPLPPQTVELVGAVRLRRMCVEMGIERAKIKNGMMLLHFVSDSGSSYYKSDLFNGVLQFVLQNKEKIVLKQNNNKLYLTVRNIKCIGDACELLSRMCESAAKIR